jgi:hypothetical protein
MEHDKGFTTGIDLLALMSISLEVNLRATRSFRNLKRLTATLGSRGELMSSTSYFELVFKRRCRCSCPTSDFSASCSHYRPFPDARRPEHRFERGIRSHSRPSYRPGKAFIASRPDVESRPYRRILSFV